MNTGHDGSMTTVHANSARDALSRLETLVLFTGLELPSHVVREQIVSAIDLVVQLTRGKDGVRRVVSVLEVVGMEGDRITTQEIFYYADDGVSGNSGFIATGFAPKALDNRI
jgi:pilus assembly protein CpaF